MVHTGNKNCVQGAFTCLLVVTTENVSLEGGCYSGTGVVESRFDFPLVSRNHIKDLLQPIPTKFLVATLKIAYQHNIAYQYQSNSITNAAI